MQRTKTSCLNPRPPVLIMQYNIQFSRFKRAYLETWDGVVVRATPAMLWAIDKDIELVIAWLDGKYISWTVQEQSTATGLSTLPQDNKIVRI